MKPNKIDQFNNLAPSLFKRLVIDFGYVMGEVKIAEINGQPWSVSHTYINKEKHLKIVIEQAPYYTDYGFTFIIYNLNNDEFNVLYIMPHEKQDYEGKFLPIAADYIFSSAQILNFISGHSWKKLSSPVFEG